MKKWQYSLAVVIAFLSGALLGLSIGNMLTSVLAGTTLAGIMAWIFSVRWESFDMRSNELSERMSIKGAWSGMGAFMFEFVSWFGRLVWVFAKVAFAILAAVPYFLFSSDKKRRAVLGFMLSVGLVAVLWMNMSVISELHFRMYALLMLAFVATTLTLLAFGLMTAIFLSSIIHKTYRDINYGKKPSSEDRSDSIARPGAFLFDWLEEFMDSKNGTFYAFVDLVVIRTMNAIRMIAFPFVFVVWGMYVLATKKTGLSALCAKKTGLSALCAMGLSFAHLSVSHAYGGIVATNPNFWLLLLIGVGAGVWLGRKIHDGWGEKISGLDFQKPGLVLASQQ